MNFLLLLLAFSPASWAGCNPCVCERPRPNYCDGKTETATGIPLDSDWKKSIYAFAIKNVAHPAWGIAHSERDYQVTKSLAQKEKISLDDDALFAAAFLHDIGGIPPFDEKGTDHAVRSVTVMEPLLIQWGFPMEKWSLVKDLVLGHTYYGPAPATLPAQAFRDADILDFLGSIGVARILATTEEYNGTRAQLATPVQTLKSFASSLPEKCSLAASREIARARSAEMQIFLNNLTQESFNETAL